MPLAERVTTCLPYHVYVERPDEQVLEEPLITPGYSG